MCFYRTEEKSTDKKEDCTGKVREKYGKSTEILNVSQEKIIDFLEEKGQITNKDVQELLGVKESRALKILRGLVELNVLERCGKSRNVYYVLK